MTAATTDQGSIFPTACHDHDACIASALATAEDLCRRRGARLTAQRRRVLELIWQQHAPVGAYDLMARLSAMEGGNVAPPTIYRALDFLLAHGLIHRIESLNAYIGCSRPGTRHAGHFLICRECHATAEIRDPELAEAVQASASARGFSLEHETVELRGLCPACQNPEAQAHGGE
jgi:Fur family zinc uptake transcriptional regulator